MTLSRFAFIGVPSVGDGISSVLQAAGFVQVVEFSSADVIFTYCITQQSLEDIYFDNPGLIQNVSKDSYLVNLSPTTPMFARELYGVACVNERKVIDAPLVVSNLANPDPFRCREDLIVLASGEREHFEAVCPMLETLSTHVCFLGSSGASQQAKMVATLNQASELVSCVESYTALRLNEFFVEPDQIVDTLTSCGVVSSQKKKLFEALIDEKYEGLYTIEIMMGELAAALMATGDEDCILPQAEAGFRLLELLAMVGGVEYAPAALNLAFCDEETTQKYNLDWTLAQGAYEDHHHNHDHFHEDEGCDDLDTYDAHNNYDAYGQDIPEGFAGFSSN